MIKLIYKPVSLLVSVQAGCRRCHLQADLNRCARGRRTSTDAQRAADLAVLPAAARRGLRTAVPSSARHRRGTRKLTGVWPGGRPAAGEGGIHGRGTGRRHRAGSRRRIRSRAPDNPGAGQDRLAGPARAQLQGSSGNDHAMTAGNGLLLVPVPVPGPDRAASWPAIRSANRRKNSWSRAIHALPQSQHSVQRCDPRPPALLRRSLTR